jgi:hypothetical protein
MLQDADHMEASCIFYVKVGMFDQLEQIKLCFLIITSLGIVMLTIQLVPILSVSFTEDPRDVIRETLADVISVEEYPFHISQS